jgi:hypothetical protein
LLAKSAAQAVMRAALRDTVWQGWASRLSAAHGHWPDIDAVHRATHELAAVEGSPAWPALATLPPPVEPALDSRLRR